MSAARAATVGPSPTSPPSRHAITTVFGHSVNGSALTVTEVGNPASPNKVLIVGCIHGNEPAGIPIAAALAAGPAPASADLWIITNLNPDGTASRTRQNAHGVDLNRNFPYRWRALDTPGGINYSGPAPLSEPEAAAAAALIRSIHPTLAIWFHQHAALIDDSQGPATIERQLSQLTGLPLATLTDYPGSAVGWEDNLFGPTAFVVELPPGALSADQVSRYTAAVRTIAAAPNAAGPPSVPSTANP